MEVKSGLGGDVHDAAAAVVVVGHIGVEMWLQTVLGFSAVVVGAVAVAAAAAA